MNVFPTRQPFRTIQKSDCIGNVVQEWLVSVPCVWRRVKLSCEDWVIDEHCLLCHGWVRYDGPILGQVIPVVLFGAEVHSGVEKHAKEWDTIGTAGESVIFAVQSQIDLVPKH